MSSDLSSDNSSSNSELAKTRANLLQEQQQLKKEIRTARAKAQRFQNDPDNTTEIDQYNVTYVGIRPNINEINFHPNISLGKWKLIYNSIPYTIYQRVL